jgi:hypothetical protein
MNRYFLVCILICIFFYKYNRLSRLRRIIKHFDLPSGGYLASPIINTNNKHIKILIDKLVLKQCCDFLKLKMENLPSDTLGCVALTNELVIGAMILIPVILNANNGFLDLNINNSDKISCLYVANHLFVKKSFREMGIAKMLISSANRIISSLGHFGIFSTKFSLPLETAMYTLYWYKYPIIKYHLDRSIKLELLSFDDPALFDKDIHDWLKMSNSSRTEFYRYLASEQSQLFFRVKEMICGVVKYVDKEQHLILQLKWCFGEGDINEISALIGYSLGCSYFVIPSVDYIDGKQRWDSSYSYIYGCRISKCPILTKKDIMGWFIDR